MRPISANFSRFSLLARRATGMQRTAGARGGQTEVSLSCITRVVRCSIAIAGSGRPYPQT
jgi:hypothetical protein